MKIRFLVLLFAVIIFALKQNIIAQDLNCNIQISTPGIEGTERKIYENMQTALYEYLNNRKWINYNLKVDERIECSFLLTITEVIGADEFKGTLQVQSRRPVYKSAYNTPLFNFLDKDIHFKYVERQPIEFTENTFTTNLACIFAYYVYIVVGMDFDSFSLNGGTPYFEKAQSIVNSAQSAPEKGWKAFESQKNRYWLVENLQNRIYSATRDFSYNYHRKGLDKMTENTDIARATITTTLESLRKVHREKPGSLLLQTILSAKSDELVNIYSAGTPTEKSQVVTLLSEIDASNAAKYKKINNAK